MTKLTNALLACLVAGVVVAAPLTASALKNDSPDAGICKSGAKVHHIKNCKENGGTK